MWFGSPREWIDFWCGWGSAVGKVLLVEKVWFLADDGAPRGMVEEVVVVLLASGSCVWIPSISLSFKLKSVDELEFTSLLDCGMNSFAVLTLSGLQLAAFALKPVMVVLLDIDVDIFGILFHGDVDGNSPVSFPEC